MLRKNIIPILLLLCGLIHFSRGSWMSLNRMLCDRKLVEELLPPPEHLNEISGNPAFLVPTLNAACSMYNTTMKISKNQVANDFFHGLCLNLEGEERITRLAQIENLQEVADIITRLSEETECAVDLYEVYHFLAGSGSNFAHNYDHWCTHFTISLYNFAYSYMVYLNINDSLLEQVNAFRRRKNVRKYLLKSIEKPWS